MAGGGTYRNSTGPFDPSKWRDCQCNTGCGLKFPRIIANRRRKYAEGCSFGEQLKREVKARAKEAARLRTAQNKELKRKLSPEELIARKLRRDLKHRDGIKEARAARRQAMGLAEFGPNSLKFGIYCAECYGMAHRRPRSGCSACKLPYAAERVERHEGRRISASEFNS